MKITLAPFGTSSDVMPMLALAKTLQSRGHAVTICAPEEFRSRIYKSEVPMVSSGPTYAQYLEGTGNLEDATSELVTKLSEDMATHFVAMRDAAREADVVIGSRLQLAAPSLTEERRIPYLYAVTTPGNADHDSFPIFGVPFDKAQKKRSKRLKEWDAQVLTALNRERKIAHLPAISNLFEYLYRTGPILLAVDQQFRSGRDLPDQIATGFFYLDLDVDLEEDNVSYLNEGTPPVYIAPLRMKEKQQIVQLSNSLIEAGHRVILGHGWSNIQDSELPAGCQGMTSLSFAQIFSKMSLIVHAGSPDLAMHAIRARIPQVIAPYTIEQKYWADQCQSAGISKTSVHGGNIGQLQQAIREMLSNPTVRQKLDSFPAVEETGTKIAAEAIEKTAQEQNASPKL
jgi:UDP:flavonoid glycosyltransferase YjiC (YdhE family)